MGNVGAPLDLSDRQEHYLDEDDDIDRVAYVCRNLPAVDLEVAQVVEDGSVEQ